MGRSLRPLDVAGGMAEGAGRSRDVEHERRETRRPLNPLISDRHTERLDGSYLENRSETVSETLRV
jgi:hypothetical protein